MLPNRLLATLSIAISLVACIENAVGQTVAFTGASRYVQAGSSQIADNGQTPSFNQTVSTNVPNNTSAYAGQNSMFGDTGVAFTGGTTSTNNSAQSVFVGNFDVSAAMPYSIANFITTSGDDTYSIWLYLNISSGSYLFNDKNGTITGLSSGVLAPDSYQFTVELTSDSTLDHSANQFLDASSSLTLGSVPEPASMMLIGVVCLGLLSRTGRIAQRT